MSVVSSTPTTLMHVGEFADEAPVMMRIDRNRGAVHHGLEIFLEDFFAQAPRPKADIAVISIEMVQVDAECDCVEINPARDKVFYAPITERGQVRYPFVRNRERTPTSYITVRVRRHSAGLAYYEVVSGYFGPAAPPVPRPRANNSQESRDFWATHALVYDEHMVGQVDMSKSRAERPW